jgi:hypothetical protein
MFISSYFLGLLLTVSAVSAEQQKPSPACRYIPGDASWPNRRQWDRLNTTVGGRLIATVPLGHVCHDRGIFRGYDAVACANLGQAIIEAGAPTL